MTNLWIWFKSLGVAIAGVIAFSGNFVSAQITPDNTLSTPSKVIEQGNTTIIEDGTPVGSYLFHSFKDFSVDAQTTAEFRNAESVENIISRVTGKYASKIEGIITAKHKANLFLINPNGIIFGPNASLNIGGSFIASTASSLNFADNTQFSATNPQSVPLLTVSAPIGLQFGATAKPILNQSSYQVQSTTVGLQVQPGKTLALVGGNINLEGGSLTAQSGRVELGSVASNSLVSLNLTDQALVLGYKDVPDFQNIRLIQRQANDGSKIPSIVSTSGNGGGNIQVQGNTVELVGYSVRLVSQTRGSIPGKDITINARKLILRDSAQVGTSTIGEGAAGNSIVNALESVELVGSFIRPDNRTIVSTLFSTTGGDGKAGDITIKTGRLLIQDGAQISADSSGTLNNSQIIAATGKGGNITVNASESIELIGNAGPDNSSIISATTFGLGESGKVTIHTEKLTVRDKAEVNVSVLGDGRNQGRTSGEINVTARSILLDGGKLTSNSESGAGGNISLQVQDLLLMRGQSKITTNAEGNRDGGGNITITAPNGFIVAPVFGNSDITANANFGSGGKIEITTKKIFGFVTRTREDVDRLDPTGQINPNNLPTNDITAFSQQNPLPSFSGTVQINSPDVDPSKGLVQLPINLVDASQQIVANCGSSAKMASSSFNNIGRGGTAPDPTQPLTADAVLADWIILNPESENPAEGMKNRVVVQKQRNTHIPQKLNYINESAEIVEAQGWITDADGNVVLVAQIPTTTPYNSSLVAASCAAH
ncbi:MAG: filamentous hemagglutinin N-terminal domain-containing protein [Nostoc sp. ChiSLP02]|nr:filamentous hemagglutinin N-terminal domain-containing protein [Nostoc sp. DedSLP05]MDZ8102687.1 filamentous hemagglutinin N-terminal domain-containing protein [Nostoc sp. DedSLP01]MDZ8186918.1 filamentous hemagglutinin N-terminal domain-containing protein [Nostoc sp. ChiSLP02]